MKHLFISLAIMMTMLSTSILSDNVKLHVTVNDGKDTSSTTVIGVVNDSASGDSDTVMYSQPLASSTWYESNDDSGDNIVPVVAIITSLGLPVFIIAIILWFMYKNNQAKYRLAAEALNAGHEIPKELFKEPSRETQTFNNGVKKTFLGIGLGVFLWLLTYNEGLAAIGFLVFCMGIAQMIIGYTSRHKESERNRVSELDKFKEDYYKRKNQAKSYDDLRDDDSFDDKEDK